MPAAEDRLPVVLVLRALGLGDLLTALPALRGLRTARPRARLVLAGPAWLGPLALLSGAVDEVVDAAPLAPLPDVPALAAGVDLAVNLHGAGPQSTRVLLAARPRRLWAAPHDDEPDTGGQPPLADGREAEVWARFVADRGAPADPHALGLPVPPPRPAPGPPPGAAAVVDRADHVVVHPGSAAPARRWPADRWVAVVAGLRADGARVLLSGSADERDGLLRLAGDAGLADDAVLAGRTDLLATARVVARARLLVAVDTGVAHLATAYGTPSVVAFGPVGPQRWGPPAGRDRHVALWAGPASDPSAPTCAAALLALGADDLLAPARRLLDRARLHP